MALVVVCYRCEIIFEKAQYVDASVSPSAHVQQYVITNNQLVSLSPCRYAAILFKKQRYVSAQHRLSIKIVCKDNFKYEVQERAATNAVSIQQLAEEYWRIDQFFLISFPMLFFIFNIIYWLAFIL